jgi:predicted kinase
MNNKQLLKVPDQLYAELTVTIQPLGKFLAILSGIPYSGKSTVAATLANHGFVHVWLTVIKRRFNIGDFEALQIADKLTRKLLENNFRVAFDFTNHTQVLRSRYIDIALAAHASYDIIWLNTDLDILYARQAQVQQSGGHIGRTVIARDVIDLFFQEAQNPSGPNVLELQNGNLKNLDHWLLTFDAT